MNRSPRAARPVPLPLDLPVLDAETSGGARLRRTIHPSGLRILSEQVPGAQSVTAGFWVGVGSRDEAPEGYGSTHFLEHLLFKGTATRTALDIAVAFDAVGGEHNAVTAKEHTCYYAKVRDRDLDLAIDVLADMVTSSLIAEPEFETERGVILEELAMADDDPGDVVNERFFEAVFGEHPLGRPIGGTPASIGAVARDAVWGHYRATYRPRDLVVTVAGAVDHDRLTDRVLAALGAGGWDLDADSAPVARRAPLLEPLSASVSPVVVPRPLEQANVLVGGVGLSAVDERRGVLSVLNSVFGGGMSSRLFQEVREKRGLAYSVYSFGAGYSDAGLFGMYAGCSPKNLPQVVALLSDELERLAADGITVDELARARGQLGGAAALALEDSDTRMSRLGRSELVFGEYLDLDASLARIDAVTADAVRELAVDLASRPRTIAAVGAVDEDGLVIQRPAA